MNFLEERIVKDGIVKPGNVLKVDSFLNHQMDVTLLDQLGKAFYERFGDKGITKILTIEASGIAIACSAARYFNVPVVFAKKSKSVNIDGDMYVAEVESFTHKNKNQVIVSKKFLSSDDHVLIIDDFLANGKALEINTSGLRQPIGKTMPTEDFVRRFKELGGEYLTLGSDAHFTQHVGANIDEGYAIAERCGFEYVTYFENRKPVKVKIEK